MSKLRPYDSTEDPIELSRKYELLYFSTYCPRQYDAYMSSKRSRRDIVWDSPLITVTRNFAKRELDRRVIGNQVKSEGDTKCQKCKSTNVTFEMAQTRSADEAQSVKYRCQSCKHEWKIR